MFRLSVVAMCFGISFSVTAQDPLPDVQEVFRLFSEERDEIQSMQARFTQLTITDNEDIESTGTIVYVNPKRIIFRYDTSDYSGAIAYMIDQSNAYEYDEELEQLLVYDVQGQPEAEAFFLGLESDSKAVRDAYDIKLLPAENSERDAFALELVPKAGDEEESIFQKVTLQLGKGDYLPRKIQIINSEESHVVFELRDFVLNAELPREKSHVFVPENTDVVINDVVMDPVSGAGQFFPEEAEAAAEESSGDE